MNENIAAESRFSCWLGAERSPRARAFWMLEKLMVFRVTGLSAVPNGKIMNVSMFQSAVLETKL
jgi:hypothetical protein